MSQIDNIKISQVQEIQAEANLRQASASLRFNLATAFYQLLYDQEDIQVSINILAMRDKASQLVTLRYESGTGYKGDMLTAKAQLFSAKADVEQVKRNLRADQRVLDQQLGLDEFTVISVTSTLSIQEPADLPNDFEPLLSKRPDIMLQQAILKTARLSLSLAKSSLWPILSANYTLSNSGPTEFSGSPHSGWGVGLNYPLFSGGPTSTYYSVAAAKSSLAKAEQDMRAVREQALSNIETIWSNFKGALDQTKVQAALLESARVRNDEADIRYSSGLMTYDNWEIIASARINQEHTAIQSLLTALNAEAAWAQALGRQLEE
jgi:outer membrane protein TolC